MGDTGTHLQHGGGTSSSEGDTGTHLQHGGGTSSSVGDTGTHLQHGGGTSSSVGDTGTHLQHRGGTSSSVGRNRYRGGAPAHLWGDTDTQLHHGEIQAPAYLRGHIPISTTGGYNTSSSVRGYTDTQISTIKKRPWGIQAPADLWGHIYPSPPWGTQTPAVMPYRLKKIPNEQYGS